MRTLVDTSIWIEVFRPNGLVRLGRDLDLEDIVTCLPVIQEVLQGFRAEHAYRVAHEAMFALPIVESPLRSALYEDAVRLYRTARGRGFTIRSSVDCLIAACAIRANLEVLHRDRDFEILSRVSELRQRSV